MIPVSVPIPSPAEPYQGSGETLLIDTQHDLASQTSYIHYAKRLLTVDDVMEAGTLSIDFSPENETLTMHSCAILRNGHWIDRLDLDRAPFISQREEELESFVYTGHLTASFILDDLREGDILEYSYSKQGVDCPFYRIVNDPIILQEDVSVKHLYCRVLKSDAASSPIHIPESYAEYLTETDDAWVWSIEESPPFSAEYDTPPGYGFPPCAIISNGSWNEVARATAPFFASDDAFGRDPEVAALINSWRETTSNPKKLATLAIRFVQDEVRYMCLSEGIFGIRSVDPLFTFKHRFGDCKGKCLLLRSLLELLDISSEVIAVNSDGFVHQDPPAFYFDHVIVRINLKGKPIYIDATIPYQGGDISYCYLPYRFGLACSEAAEELERIDMKGVDLNSSYQTVVTFDDEGNSTLEVLNKNYGHCADIMRSLMKCYGQDWFYNEVVEQTYNSLGDLSLIDQKFQDDRSSNCTTYRASWQLDPPDQIEFLPTIALHVLSLETAPDRKAPLYLQLTGSFKETLYFPGIETEENETTIEHEGFTFTRKDLNDEEGSKVEFQLTFHSHVIEPESFESLQEAIDQVREVAVLLLGSE